MYAVNLTGTLRVSTEGELEGLDLHEHGMLAYPEFPMHPSQFPQPSSLLLVVAHRGSGIQQFHF